MEEVERVVEIVKGLAHQPNVFYPTDEEIQEKAQEIGRRTEFGNFVFFTSVRSRSAGSTVYIGSPKVMQPRLNERQKEIVKNLPRTISLLSKYLRKAPLICVKRTMGDNPHFTPHCTMFVSVQRKDGFRLAYMWSKLMFNPTERRDPDFYLVCVPEWQEKDRQILVFPEVGITFVLGSDYLGEPKKGFLRMAMWEAKNRGMLGLHAGAKIIRARDKNGKIRRYSMLLFGLSGTGKTTHSCHRHGLTEEGEGVEIVQDDVIFLRKDGSALGPERGFFLKTDIEPVNQPLIYRAATKKNAILENVMIDHQGKVYFLDDTLTGNGRGVILRSDLGKENLSSTINLPPLDELDGLIIAFITRRNTVVPIVSKLTPEQGAAFFMLGESIETSAGDPRRAGESIRVVGTNPFIIGDEAEEGNWFYEFLKAHPQKIQCYLLNTGGVGEIIGKNTQGEKVVLQKVLRVQISEMASIIRGIARGMIKWQNDPYFGNQVPEKIEGVNLDKFNLSRFYSKDQIEAYVNQLKRERREYLQKFPNLNPDIVNAVS